MQLGVYTITSNLEGGKLIPYLPSESVPSVLNNFVFFLMKRFSLNLIQIAHAAVEVLSLVVSFVVAENSWSPSH